jgi:hypothetical protein
MRLVGVIEVNGPASSERKALLKTAVQEGKEIGCDALVHQALYEMRSATAFGRWNLQSRRNGIAAWQFMCAVEDGSRDPVVTKAALDAAIAIQADEGALPTCGTEQFTGSHLPLQLCHFES